MTSNDPHARPVPPAGDDGRPAALPLIPAASEPPPGLGADESNAAPDSRQTRKRARQPDRAPNFDDGPALHETHEVRDVHDIHEIRDIHDEARPAPRRASAPFMRSHPLHLVSLGFGTGLAPFAPGLVGSLFGWLSFVALAPHLSPARWLVLIAAGFALGLVATHYTARALGGGRPRAIVWDQILATWIVMLLVTPASFGQQLTAFVLLRLVLRLRPPPMRRFDRRFDPRFDHRLKAGFGIMIDDLVAAFLTLLAIATWHAVFSTPG